MNPLDMIVNGASRLKIVFTRPGSAPTALRASELDGINIRRNITGQESNEHRWKMAASIDADDGHRVYSVVWVG